MAKPDDERLLRLAHSDDFSIARIEEEETLLAYDRRLKSFVLY